MGWEGDGSDWHLLLPALAQGSGCVHRGHHPQQVGSLEGGLGDHARRWSRPPCATNRGPNGKARLLGGGSKAAAAFHTHGRADQAPGQLRLDVDDGAIRLSVEMHQTPLDARSSGVAVHQRG
jgi:hypothetical protein